LINWKRICHVLTLALCLTVSLPDANADDAERRAVTLGNDGTEAIACQIVFTHWVTGPLEAIAPGRRLSLSFLRQAKDGALFQRRESDGRPMMIEQLWCGPLEGFVARGVGLPLLPLQSGAVMRSDWTCAMTDSKLRCRLAAEGEP